MIDDMLVADAVIHCYNWVRENWTIPEAAIASAGGAGFHSVLSSDDETRLSPEEFLRNWSVDELERTMFYESDTDLVAYHGTPIWDFFKDGHSDTEKGFVLKERQPERTILYGAVNPYQGQKALDDIDELADRGCNALKVYAAFYDNHATTQIRLDDPEFSYPFIQKALDRGFRIIATHKAVPFGPVDPHKYGVQDIPDACAAFPEMQFEIVHAGFAFVEETAFLAALPNCWFNLEVSAALIFNAPRRFAEFMGQLLMMGAGERLVFATGCGLVHPQPSISAFRNFQMPKDLVEGYGYPEVGDDLKRAILGENYLRLHGIDRDRFIERTADDDISRYRAAHGIDAPWTHLRAGAVSA